MLNRIDLSRADLNLLVLFEVVLEERNVGRAAERLSLTPSAVSHGLGRLRRLLNDPLFLRTPRGVVPSARATELAARSRRCWRGARAVIAAAGAVRSGKLQAPVRDRRARRRFRRSSCRRCWPSCGGPRRDRHRRAPAPPGAGGDIARARLAPRLRRAGGARHGCRDRPPDAIPARFHARLALRGGFRHRDAGRTPVRGRSDPGRRSAARGIWSSRIPAIRMASSTSGLARGRARSRRRRRSLTGARAWHRSSAPRCRARELSELDAVARRATLMDPAWRLAARSTRAQAGQPVDPRQGGRAGVGTGVMPSSSLSFRPAPRDPLAAAGVPAR